MRQAKVVQKADGQLTYREAADRAGALLAEEGYDQVPQLAYLEQRDQAPLFRPFVWRYLSRLSPTPGLAGRRRFVDDLNCRNWAIAPVQRDVSHEVQKRTETEGACPLSLCHFSGRTI